MATFLSKLFKPKWQSKHLETRKQALSSLDSFKAEDQKILTLLAETDPSTEIQKLAIEKINDSATLINLHKKAAEPLKIVIESRLYDIATAQSLSIFDLITDLDLLTEMMIKANQAESFILGLARIQDACVLFKIATQSRNTQIRQAAAELIETEKVLSELFTHAKGKDKAVYQITKTKLAVIRAKQQKHAEQQALIDKLLNDVNNLAKTEALQHFDARLAHLVKQWNTIKSVADDTQTSSFEALLLQCQQKLAAIDISTEDANTSHQKAEESITDEQTRAQSEAAKELAETISTIQDTLIRFQNKPANELETSALDALIKTQENRWLEASREHESSKAQQVSYQEGMSQLRNYLKAMHSLTDNSEPLNSVIAQLSEHDLSAHELEQHVKKLKSIISNINWPNQFKLPDIIIEAQNALEASKDRKASLAEKQKRTEQQIAKQLNAIDAVLEDKQIKEATKLFKQLQANLSTLESRRADAFQAAIALRKNQLNELKDWQGFVSTPKQEELCAAMERLAETHIDPNEKADKIKQMQQEWKSLGGTGDQALWSRFKTAADKAFEPCALFFAEQKQLKDANLNKRKTLLSQLTDYVNTTEWEKVSSQNSTPIWQTADWKTAEKINRQARQEWRDAYPIDFKANKSLQVEFNQLMAVFDKHLENERSYNLSLKQAIVEQAQALIDADDIDASIQKVKSLQESWQKVGITHHKEDRKLWTNYRAACDAIFAKRNQVRDEKRSELNDAIEQADAICRSIEEASSNLESKSTDELKALLGANRKLIDTIPTLPTKAREKLNQRIATVTDSIKQTIKLHEKSALLAKWQEAARKAAILRAVFNDATLINETTKSDFASSFSLDADLEKQFEDAWNLISEDNKQALKTIDAIQARELCITCEVAAGIESPDEDKALRMQLQVSRLSEGLSSSSETLSKEAQLEKALTAWYTAFAQHVGILSDLEPRIEAARDGLLTPQEQPTKV